MYSHPAAHSKQKHGWELGLSGSLSGICDFTWWGEMESRMKMLMTMAAGPDQCARDRW